MKKSLVVLTLLPMLAVAAACTTSKSSNPLSPSIAGPIPGVDISAPKLLEPGSGWQMDSTKQPLTLLVENALTSGARPLTYTFEVATDADLNNKVFTRDGISQGDGGRTSLRLPDALAGGRTYYWRAKAGDGANTGPYASAVNFNVFIPIVISEPAPVSPVNDVTVSDTHPRFTFNNAPTSGPVGAMTYTVEIATDSGFSNKVAVWNVAQQPSQTNLDAPANLSNGKTYYWRVRGSEASGAMGPWSSTQSFKTPAAPAPPSGGGGGGGNPKPCGPPYPTTPFGIVECQRSHYGHMSSGEMVSFLQAVARDLNASSIGGGPYGLLRKTGGSNCGGFSCDIICTGSGNSQKQWDVLGDADGAQTPEWIGPKTYPDIRVDLCSVP